MAVGAVIRGWVGGAVTALIALAYMAQALIPAGYMPERQHSGLITVTLCSGDGSHKTIDLAIPGQPPAPKSSKNSCPYATPNIAILDYAAPVLQAAEAHVFKTALVEAVQAPAYEAWRSHAPPTGPPAQA